MWNLRVIPLLVGALFAAPGHTLGAEIAGVVFPREVVADGTRLVLNGVGRRTYSIFEVTVYVAALYLERRATSESSILDGSQKTLFEMNVRYPVSRDDHRASWAYALDRSCAPHCAAIAAPRARFLALIDAVAAGDRLSFYCPPGRVVVSANGSIIANIEDLAFHRVMLQSWLGRSPPTEELKRGLLGGS